MLFEKDAFIGERVNEIGAVGEGPHRELANGEIKDNT